MIFSLQIVVIFWNYKIWFIISIRTLWEKEFIESDIVCNDYSLTLWIKELVSFDTSWVSRTYYFFSFMEVHQVLVVSEDLHEEGGAIEVVSSGFQSTDDGKEFLVIDVIVSFSRDERLGEI